MKKTLIILLILGFCVVSVTVLLWPKSSSTTVATEVDDRFADHIQLEQAPSTSATAQEFQTKCFLLTATELLVKSRAEDEDCILRASTEHPFGQVVIREQSFQLPEEHSGIVMRRSKSNMYTETVIATDDRDIYEFESADERTYFVYLHERLLTVSFSQYQQLEKLDRVKTRELVQSITLL